MFCPKCGEELQPNVKFCPGCGLSLETFRRQQAKKESAQTKPQSPPKPPQPTQPQQPVSQSTQSQQPTQPQPTQSQPRPPQPTQTQPTPTQTPQQQQPSQPKKRKLWPIIAAAAAAVVIVIIAVVAFAVLPSTQSTGIWVPTKAASVYETDGYTSADEYVWTLDDRGNPTTTKINDTYTFTSTDSKGNESTTNGALVTTYTRTFDDDGRVVTQNSETKDATDDRIGTTKINTAYKWETDSAGKTTGGASEADDGSSCKYTYEYNSQGYVSKKSGDGTDSDDGKFTNEYEYETDGTIVKSVHTNDGETKEYTYTYERDAKNRPVKRTLKTVNKTTGKTVSESTTTYGYDENGNIISVETEDTSTKDDGTSKKSTSKYAIEYTWVEDPSPWRKQMQHQDLGYWVNVT